MPTHSGSLREWVNPDSPKVSYAVAMVVEMKAQACEMSCQLGLRRSQNGHCAEDMRAAHLVAA